MYEIIHCMNGGSNECIHSCSELFHTFTATSIHAVNYFIHSLLPEIIHCMNGGSNECMK